MSKVEVLIATMHRKNIDFLSNMNIQTDCVVANQADTNAVSNTEINGYKVKFVTTKTRGLSINRNIAFSHASGDYLLIADDDLTYEDSLVEKVEHAFNSLPQADIIVFNVAEKKAPENRNMIPQNKTSFKVGITNFSRYGSCCIAIRSSAFDKSELHMNEVFGTGSGIYNCGEDSIFLRNALRHKHKIYAFPKTISVIDQSSSTWFTNGYDARFMFDKGAVCKEMFPFASIFLIWYFIIKFSRKSSLGMFKCARLMYSGMRAKKHSKSYADIFNVPKSIKGERL